MIEGGASTRDKIVTATRKLINERGIAHITTKQIAQAAKCAEGTIFLHFARKEDLLLAVSKNHSHRYLAKVHPNGSVTLH
jgi:AcrR family transcriptional regulator